MKSKIFVPALLENRKVKIARPIISLAVFYTTKYILPNSIAGNCFP